MLAFLVGSVDDLCMQELEKYRQQEEVITQPSAEQEQLSVTDIAVGVTGGFVVGLFSGTVLEAINPDAVGYQYSIPPSAIGAVVAVASGICFTREYFKNRKN